MVDAQKDLTLREVTAAEILPFVTIAANFALDHEKDKACAVANRGRSFIVSESGTDIAGYTLQQIGNELWIESAAGAAGAAGKARIDLVALIAGLVQEQGGKLDALMFKTTRRGLVKKAQTHGFEIAAYIMRKKL